MRWAQRRLHHLYEKKNSSYDITNKLTPLKKKKHPSHRAQHPWLGESSCAQCECEELSRLKAFDGLHSSTFSAVQRCWWWWSRAPPAPSNCSFRARYVIYIAFFSLSFSKCCWPTLARRNRKLKNNLRKMSENESEINGFWVSMKTKHVGNCCKFAVDSGNETPCG